MPHPAWKSTIETNVNHPPTYPPTVPCSKCSAFYVAAHVIDFLLCLAWLSKEHHLNKVMLWRLLLALFREVAFALPVLWQPMHKQGGVNTAEGVNKVHLKYCLRSLLVSLCPSTSAQPPTFSPHRLSVYWTWKNVILKKDYVLSGYMNNENNKNISVVYGIWSYHIIGEFSSWLYHIKARVHAFSLRVFRQIMLITCCLCLRVMFVYLCILLRKKWISIYKNLCSGRHARFAKSANQKPNVKAFPRYFSSLFLKRLDARNYKMKLCLCCRMRHLVCDWSPVCHQASTLRRHFEKSLRVNPQEGIFLPITHDQSVNNSQRVC